VKYISNSDNPDIPSGNFHFTVGGTGMVDVTRRIAEDLAVDVVLVAEGKNIGIPLRQSLGTLCFVNPLTNILNHSGIFFNIL
jgi:hypothetical protein